MTLRELTKDMNFELLQGDMDAEVTDITNDSRNVKEGGLFFAITGLRSDGHDFVSGIISRKPSVIVVQKYIKAPREITVIRFDDTRLAMGIISSRFYGDPSKKMTVIGITGTRGKTESAVMIRDILETAGHRTGLICSLGITDGISHMRGNTTTPESIVLHRLLRDMAEKGIRHVIIEVSSQGLKLDRVAGVHFDYGIFTNLSPNHITHGEHASFEEYEFCKSLLFSASDHSVLNSESKYSPYMADAAAGDIIAYGMDERAEYSAENVRLYRESGMLFTSFDVRGRARGHIEIPLPGTFTVYNALCAIAVCSSIGAPIEAAREALGRAYIRGRNEMLPECRDFVFMLDDAHNAASLENMLAELGKYEHKRIISIFGCSGNTDKAARIRMGQVSGRNADITVITSDNPMFENPDAIIDDIAEGVKAAGGEYVREADREKAIRYAVSIAEKGDIIICAGKGDSDYQDIGGVRLPLDEREIARRIMEE